MWSKLPSNPRRERFVVGLFLLTLGMGALALPALGLMSMRGVSIFDLEFMRTSADASMQVARLGPDGVVSAKVAVYVDFPLLVLYALTLSAACVVVAARFMARGSFRLAATANRVAWLAPIAAACDAVENVAILRILAGHVDQPWPGMAFGFATVKFVMLAVVVIFLLVGLVLARDQVSVQVAEPTGATE